MQPSDRTVAKVFRATRTDFDLVRTAIAEVHGRAAVDEQALATFLADGSCYLFVAVIDDRVVGSLNGYSLHRPHKCQLQFLLYEIDVRKEYRRRGIGSALVNAFVDAARRCGAFEMWVLTNDSNEAAMALYRRCGFARGSQDDVVLTISFSHEAPGRSITKGGETSRA